MRKFILLMVLAWLPIQASAMPWLAFKCERHDAVTHEHAASAGGHAHQASGGGDASADDTDGGTISNVHTCCHHFSGAAATLPQPCASAIGDRIEPRPLARLYSFFPEPLKRPPLGALV